MHKSEAIEKYLSILDRIAPGWDAPPDPAVSLSNPWMVNEDTTGCILCHEAFTFLNRRHHVRFKRSILFSTVFKLSKI